MAILTSTNAGAPINMGHLYTRHGAIVDATTAFFLYLDVDNAQIAFSGTDFSYAGNALAGGTISEIVFYGSNGVSSASVTGLSIAATTLQQYIDNDNLFGFAALLVAGNDSLTGSSASDVLIGGAGNDSINGGAGTDTAANSGGFRQYLVTGNPTGNPTGSAIVQGPDGSDTLSSVERLLFIDGTMHYDPASPLAQVARLYLAAFGRVPDPLGLNYHYARGVAGTPLTATANEFVVSPEFVAGGFLINVNFVNRLYENVLHRPRSNAETYWITEVNRGVSRGEVLLGFSESPEFIAFNAPLFAAGLWDIDETVASVARLYFGVLGRDPDLGGLLYHAVALKSGQSTLSQTALNFIASPEFQITYGNPDNEHLVNLLYGNILGRGRAPSETYWIDQLNAGVTRGDVLLGFTESPEYQLRTVDRIDRGISVYNLIQATDGDDDLFGSERNDSIAGGPGNDRLNGGGGLDSLDGGPGDDTYVVDNPFDIVIEAPNEGTDLVLLSAESFILPANVENLTLTGTASINGSGNALGNIIVGNAGNNLINGGPGADSMTGGAGDDTYVVDNPADVVIEAPNEGIDLVISTAASYVLPANVENLTLDSGAPSSGTGNEQNNTVTGNEMINLIEGGAGDDALHGGSGTDTASYAGAGSGVTVNLTILTSQNTDGAGVDTLSGFENLTGSAFNDALMGDGGSNELNGGAGADSMTGGAGSDIYYVDDPGDAVIEVADVPGVIDEVRSSISYTIPIHVERLTLIGSGPISGTGGDNNTRIVGNDAANVLLGGSGYTDELFGMDGNDVLDVAMFGGRMYGGKGDDVYLVRSNLDWIEEFAGEGIDTVDTYVHDGGLPANVENLILRNNGHWGGNASNNTMIGSASTDWFDGGSGDDTLVSGGGNDRLYGDGGNDTAVFGGFVRQYELFRTNNVLQGETGMHGPDGIETFLRRVEMYQFVDGTLYFTDSIGPVNAARLYLAAFDRPPDPLERHVLIGQANSGVSLATMAADFVASAEFQAIYGALENEQFADLLYLNMLDRARDPAENFWVTELDNGAARSEVLIGLAQSQEFRVIGNPLLGFASLGTVTAGTAIVRGLWDFDETAASVARLYLGGLGHAPTVAQLADETGAIKGGQLTLLQDAEALALNADFLALYGGLDDAQYVNQLYLNLFQRAPQAGELSDGLDYLADHSRAAELLQLTESQEYQLETIGQLDRGILALDAHFP